MKSAIFVTALFVLLAAAAPRAYAAPDCCFIDLFCSSKCVSLVANGQPWRPGRVARSSMDAYSVGVPEGQPETAFYNVARRNVHAGRLFAPAHRLRRRETETESKRTSLLERLAGSR